MFPFITSTINFLGGRCPHNCVYCVTGDTLVLKVDLTWEPIETIKVGERILAFSEKPKNRYWHLEIAEITTKTKQKKMVYLIKTSEGEIKTTEEHYWLTNRNRWRKTLDINKYKYPIRFLMSPSESFKQHNEKYKMGYLSGLVEGDGTYRLTPSIKRFRSKDGKFTKNTGERSVSSYFRIAIIDMEPLIRVQDFLKTNGITLSIRPFVCNSKRQLFKIETWTKSIIKRIIGFCREQENKEYMKGYLAGIFDAEGSIHHNLRISNYDNNIVAKTKKYGSIFGFDFKIEEKGLILKGGLRERLRFFSKVNPVIQRKKDAVISAIKKHKYAKIISVKKIGVEPVYDITTTSKTFFANGFFSHNCWSMGKKGLVNKYDMEKYRGEPRLYEKEFKRKFKDDDVVFVQDMSDLFAENVPTRYILRILDYIRQFRKTKFLTLTKNNSRYFRFLRDKEVPKNVILGVTIETDFYRFELEHGKWMKYSDICLNSPSFPQDRILNLMMMSKKYPEQRFFISIEPILNFGLNTQIYKPFLKIITEINPWAVAIGYDNYNWHLPEPRLEKTLKLIEELEKAGIKVYRKTLRKAWYE